ncbi:MAG: hypothetical protein ACXU86_20705, partial [Archangium sp.]
RDYAVQPPSEDTSLSTDKQGPRLLARTFFNQLRASGYTPMQIIGVATELLDVVSEGIKGEDKNVAQATPEARPDFRQEV